MASESAAAFAKAPGERVREAGGGRFFTRRVPGHQGKQRQLLALLFFNFGSLKMRIVVVVSAEPAASDHDVETTRAPTSRQARLRAHLCESYPALKRLVVLL